MQSFLPKTLPDFAAAKVLVIGDVMLDRYWFGDTARISPEAPVPIVTIDDMNDRPGGAGNVALNLAALGTRTMLLGCAGQDEAALALETQLSNATVLHRLHKSATASTIIKLRVISRHQQLIRLDFENHKHFSQDNLVDEYVKQLVTTQLVIISDYKKGTLSDPRQLIELARALQIPVLVDPKGTDFNRYRHANLITPNFKEFEAVMGHCVDEADVLAKGRALLTQYDISNLLITRGERGMTLITTEETIHLPAYAREVFDVTGAGDTVIGVLGAALAAGTSLKTAVALANLGASITVSKLGAATVSPEELQAVIANNLILSNGILTEEQLVLAVNDARAQGKKIVFTNGCFDILHAGHVTYLQMARTLGDCLIVAVNDDASIRTLKGENRPVNAIDQRMTVLAGLDAVDWVIPFADKTPERLLQLIKPDVLVKGRDYQLNEVVGADIVRAYGGEVRIMSHEITTSSTTILSQLAANGDK